MNKTEIKFRFPQDIHLTDNSLVEAWLEIRWQLEESDGQLRRDPEFESALWVFYENVKDRFSHRTALDSTKLPVDFAPHLVRYQFRKKEDEWPVIQLGPGIASINYTTTYNWRDFKKECLFLREQLTTSYERNLTIDSLVLRYRNSIPFQYSQNNLFEFLSENLNVAIDKPYSIPGNAGKSESPIGLNLVMSFDLGKETGNGTLKLGTGVAKETDNTTGLERKSETIVFEFEVASRKEKPPNLYDKQQFEQWITSAHLIIHDWYFSLIDGPIREEYTDSKRD